MRKTLSIMATGALLAFPGAALAQTPSATGYGSTPVPIPPTTTAPSTAPAEDETLGVIGQIDTPEEKAPAEESAPSQGETEAQPSQPVELKGESLPFTGQDAGIVAALGLALLFAGVFMRRLHGRSEA